MSYTQNDHLGLEYSSKFNQGNYLHSSWMGAGGQVSLRETYTYSNLPKLANFFFFLVKIS